MLKTLVRRRVFETGYKLHKETGAEQGSGCCCLVCSLRALLMLGLTTPLEEQLGVRAEHFGLGTSLPSQSFRVKRE